MVYVNSYKDQNWLIPQSITDMIQQKHVCFFVEEFVESLDFSNLQWLRKSRKIFLDLRDKPEVNIDMKNTEFQPARIIIKSGTKSTWTNKDVVSYYVTTDPHPGHNYFSEQTSPNMAVGKTVSLVFSKPGGYPYHCSAHASVMVAEIIVG